VANLVAVPIAFLIMAVAMLSLSAGVASQWMASVFNNTNWLLVKVLVGFLGAVAALPGAYRYVPYPDPSRPILSMTVYDTGAYGGACSLLLRDGVWLFDCGPMRSIGPIILPGLRMSGVVRLDGLLVSCGSGSRIGGWQALLASFPLGMVEETDFVDRFQQQKHLNEALRARGIPIVECSAGDRIRLGRDVWAKVLYPPPGNDSAPGEDQALVVRLEASTTRILFLSDTGIFTDQWLLRNAGRQDLVADILIVGHGRVPGPDLDFIRAVHPKLIVVPQTRMDFQSQGRKGWLDAAAAIGARIMDQDTAGAAMIRIYPDRYSVKGFLDGLRYDPGR
jgi:competence protein ComEC